MSDSNDDYIGILIEQIRDEVKTIHEEVGGMRVELKQLPKREEFEELKQDVKVIKAAVTDQSGQLEGYEHRISELEAAA